MVTEMLIFLFLIPYITRSQNILNNSPVLAEDFKVAEFPNKILWNEDEKKLGEFLTSMNDYEINKSTIKDIGLYCQSLRTCFECIKRRWYPCNWCHNYGCTHKSKSACPYAADTYDKTTENACPSIKHQGHILIAAGVKASIKVKLHATDLVIYDKEILCQIQFREKLLHVKALILSDMVYCSPMLIERRGIRDIESGTLKLIWGGVEPFSNEIRLIVYSCEHLATDCESCRMLPQEYQCGWCEAMNSCVVGEKCVNDYMKWTLSKLTCQPYGKKLYYV